MMKQLVAMVGFAMAFALALATPVSAGIAQVSGNQIPAGSGDSCIAGAPSSLATFTMEGSLIGCWYTDEFAFREHPSGTVQATGHEHFVGCLDLGGDGACTGDPSGRLDFSFQFTGKFDTVTFAEIRGRCQHPIVSASGGFDGAAGVLMFKDDVSTGTATYTGHVTL